MKEFGAYLQQARFDADLSLEALHDSTRISLKNLRLIESGDFPSLPQTYVRAFVREYARAVGLDEEETLETYNAKAEAEKGIPPPPAAIDSSNLLPQMDDSIEYIEPMERGTPVHVEVEGDAEVEDDPDYTPPVRKSSYVTEDDASAIDIRTAPATAPEETTVSPSRPSKEKPLSKKQKKKSDASTEKPEKSEAVTTPPARTADTPPVTSAGKPASAAKSSSAAPGETTAGKRASRGHSVFDAKPPVKEKVTDKASSDKKESTEETSTTPPPPPPAARNPNTTDEKRILIMGTLVVAIIAIAIYGIYYFSRGDAEEAANIDSTAIKASIEAGRFIDSSQSALTEIPVVPEDTLPAEPIPAPEPVEAKPRDFEKDDSLVLEAFTNAPVWFSIKMDTLRTERGSLSSNEHRVWRANDYFVITLGDAGAVTFFLNGKEIGTLGDEGAVVKNVTLSRQHLGGN